MLFPSISMAIEYTCIISVSEYSKLIRLPFKSIEVPYYSALHPSGRSYRAAVSCQVSNSSYIIQGLKEFLIQLINPLSDSSCKDSAIC